MLSQDADIPMTRWILQWHPLAEVEISDDTAVVRSPLCLWIRKQLSPGLRAVLEMLSGQGGSEEQLADRAEEVSGPHQLAHFFYLLRGLFDKSLLMRSLEVEGRQLARVVPLSRPDRFEPGKAATRPGLRLRLCRFACVRRWDGDLLLESPLSPCQVILQGWQGASLLGILTEPRFAQQLHRAVPGLSPPSAQALAGLLLDAQIAWPVDEQGMTADEHPAQQWEFHDLLFHSRSRLGWHLNPLGATYPFTDQVPPALKPTAGQSERCRIELDRPNLDEMQDSDPPYCQVQEARKSIRTYAPEPLTVRQVGEFLFRVARLRLTFQIEKVELSSRPYPSGGACYPLEFYLLVRSCRGLDPGLFHYQPGSHSLCPLEASPEALERLFKSARRAVGGDLKPQLMIVLTARFQRLSWKYQSVVYATILKEVGVVMQTMYLCATAMGLAGCALGSGDSRIFGEAAGLDYCTESSVGEFLLGSLGLPQRH